MTEPHRPNREFLSGLHGRIESESRRMARFEPPQRKRRTILVPVLIALVVVLLGAGGVVAAGKLEEAAQKKLLVERAKLLLDTANNRAGRLQGMAKSAERAYEAGFTDRDVLRRQALRAHLAHLEVQRLTIDHIEVQQTGRLPRDDAAAPRIGERDHVSDRLRLRLEALEWRKAGEKEAGPGSLAARLGYPSREELEESILHMEEGRTVNTNKAMLVRNRISKLLESHELLPATLVSTHETLVQRQRSLIGRVESLRVEVNVRTPLRAATSSLLARIEATPLSTLSDIDLAAYRRDERLEELREELVEALAELEALEEMGQGPEHPNVKAVQSQVTRYGGRLRARLKLHLKQRDAHFEEAERLLASYVESAQKTRVELQAFTEVKRKHDALLEQAERYEAEAGRYERLLEKLQSARLRTGEDSEGTVQDSGEPSTLDLEAAHVQRLLDIRSRFLAGEMPAEDALLETDLSAAQFRKAAATLRLEKTRSDLERLKRQHSMGLATRAEVREAEGTVLDLEAEARVAAIDIEILMARLGR